LLWYWKIYLFFQNKANSYVLNLKIDVVLKASCAVVIRRFSLNEAPLRLLSPRQWSCEGIFEKYIYFFKIRQIIGNKFKQGQRKAWRIPSPKDLTQWPWPLTLKINKDPASLIWGTYHNKFILESHVILYMFWLV
jgi:hypothetical protein